MDREIVEYRIISSSDAGNLAKAINESIKTGWVPQGGVAIGMGGFPMQAMVKYKPLNQ